MNVEKAFHLASDVGYDGMEIMVTPNAKSRDAGYLNALVEEYGKPITSIHAPTLLLCSFVWGREPVRKLELSAELAHNVGADTVVLHPPFKRNPYSNRFLDVVAELEAKTGLHFAVENMFPWIYKGRSKTVYGPSLEETAATADSLTFDFSHAAAAGLNPLPHIKENWQKINVIHFCDGKTRTFGKEDSLMDEHLLPGEGNQPIREVYRFLNSVGWEGSTVLEINTRDRKTYESKKEALQQSIDFFRSL